ncbi:MAG: exosortase-associated protein EpsI, B-type [Rhizobacter sp.]
MKPVVVAALVAGLMITASVASAIIRPPVQSAESKPTYVLDAVIPKRFGNWQELPQAPLVVNPQTQQLLDRLYSQVLARTYVNASGYRVMLSLAYGGDQRGDLQAHKPEVCYPAQGFTLHSSQESQLATRFGSVETRQLSTSLGARKEPVTYWFTMGDTVVRSRFQQRMLELRFKLTGQIPAGLLFRVSSIDDNSSHAFEQQRVFVDDLLSVVSAHDRHRLSGLLAAAQP